MLRYVGNFVSFFNPNLNFSGQIEDKTQTIELGDRLPDELTQLVLLSISPLNWGQCSLVCRKWNRLILKNSLWEAASKNFEITFPKTIRLEETTNEYKKIIYFHLKLDIPAQTQEELLNKIKKIYRSMKPKDFIEIEYKPSDNKEVFFKIKMIKPPTSHNLYDQSIKADHTYHLCEKNVFGNNQQGQHDSSYSSSISGDYKIISNNINANLIIACLDKEFQTNIMPSIGNTFLNKFGFN